MSIQQTLVRAALLLPLVAWGCREADPDGTGGAAGTCGEGEVVVAYLGTDDDHDECAPTPAACEVADPCSANDCVSALYDLCEAGTLGTACSDGGMTTIVSCN